MNFQELRIGSFNGYRLAQDIISNNSTKVLGSLRTDKIEGEIV